VEVAVLVVTLTETLVQVAQVVAVLVLLITLLARRVVQTLVAGAVGRQTTRGFQQATEALVSLSSKSHLRTMPHSHLV
jgi:hypothetical protein